MIKPLVLSDIRQNDTYALLNFIDYVLTASRGMDYGVFIEQDAVQKLREITEELKRREALRKDEYEV